MPQVWPKKKKKKKEKKASKSSFIFLNITKARLTQFFGFLFFLRDLIDKYIYLYTNKLINIYIYMQIS